MADKKISALSSATWIIGDNQAIFGTGSGYTTYTYGAIPTILAHNSSTNRIGEVHRGIEGFMND